jgi:hypothetical protein
MSVQLKNFRSGKRAHGDAASADTKRNPTADDTEVLVHFLASLD